MPDEPHALRPGVVREIEALVLGEEPTLTRLDVAELSGVPIELSQVLWRLLGFPAAADDEVAFTHADVEAARTSLELMQMGVVSQDTQAAMVRTLARSFARLAEWQSRLVAEIGDVDTMDDEQYLALSASLMPRIESLQNYVWRRHLASASASLLTSIDTTNTGEKLAVCFVDIVGYTSRSKELTEAELIDWVEQFEDAVTEVVVDHGGQVIKTIGDEVLFVASDPHAAVTAALILTTRGSDEDDPFPAVRAGIAHGDVVRRLGDVFGPTVNIASRLTSLGRPGTVLADQGVHDLLCVDHAAEATRAEDLKFKRLPRASVKGYSRLNSWKVRRADA